MIPASGTIVHDEHVARVVGLTLTDGHIVITADLWGPARLDPGAEAHLHGEDGSFICILDADPDYRDGPLVAAVGDSIRFTMRLRVEDDHVGRRFTEVTSSW